MAGKKGGAGGGLAVFIVGGLIWLLVSIPREVWILLVVVAIVYGLVKLFGGGSRPQQPASSTPDVASRLGKPGDPQKGDRSSAPDQPVSLRLAGGWSRAFEIPRKTSRANQDGRWIPKGESISIQGIILPGGMIYVGTSLDDGHGRPEPGLIDKSKPISKQEQDYRKSLTVYWSSYSTTTPEARRAYLQWLADGRQAPDADVGFMFLFFYGLERRVLFDYKNGVAPKEELPIIAAEVHRLLSIYGAKSGSVRNYLPHFIELVELSGSHDNLYAKELPNLQKSFELPFRLKLALGQAARDGVGVPPNLALAWAELDPAITRRHPVTRCSGEFRRLFLSKYKEEFPQGLKLPINKTRLKFAYQPASPTFMGSRVMAGDFADVPDVTVLTGPTKKLQSLVDFCTSQLESYSRLLGRSPEKRETLEALLLLPPSLWPRTAFEELDGLRTRMAGGMLTIQFSELAAKLGGGDLTREKVISLARALSTLEIGMEPDVLSGAKVPKPAEKVVLFQIQEGDIAQERGSGYNVAQITVQLAAAVANADGDFGPQELRHISQQIDTWHHLTTANQRRLKAHLRLLRETPIGLSPILKKLEPLHPAAKKAIGTFAAAVSQVDGEVTPEEMRFLEKLYRGLGLEGDAVYSDVHAAQANPPARPAGGQGGNKSTFQLDPNRIAELQKETEKASAMLATIFVDEETPPPEPPAIEKEGNAGAIWGMDEAHSTFLRALTSRHQWTRGELADIAADLHLMLDGAMEHINDAAFDRCNLPLFEGEDPVDLNPEVLESIKTEHANQA